MNTPTSHRIVAARFSAAQEEFSRSLELVERAESYMERARKQQFEFLDEDLLVQAVEAAYEHMLECAAEYKASFEELKESVPVVALDD